MEDNNSLASEILGMLKAQLRNAHIIIVILIIALFASNMMWLYAWSLPVEETTTTETVTQDGEGINNYVGNDSDITNVPDNN